MAFLLISMMWWWAGNHVFDFSEKERGTRWCTLSFSGFLCQHHLYCAPFFSGLMVETPATISMILLHKDTFAQLLELFPVVVTADRSAAVMTNVKYDLCDDVLLQHEKILCILHIQALLWLSDLKTLLFWDKACCRNAGSNTVIRVAREYPI